MDSLTYSTLTLASENSVNLTSIAAILILVSDDRHSVKERTLLFKPLSICAGVCLSVCLSVYLCMRLCLNLSVYFCLPLCVSVAVPVAVPVSESISLSVSLCTVCMSLWSKYPYRSPDHKTQ